jgi:hypothetical protein
VGDGTCEVSMSLVTDLTRELKIDMLTGSVEGCQSVNMVQIWSEIVGNTYRQG